MNKIGKLIVGSLLAVSLVFSSVTPASAQGLQPQYPSRTAYHITTNTTNTVTSSDTYVVSIVICCTVAGASSNTLTIQNKEGTPKVIFKATNIAVGTTVINLFGTAGAVYMKGGIDIITATGTAPTADVFVTTYKF